MALRTIFTTEQGVNPPAFGKIPGQDAYYPLLQIDDANGWLYNGGVHISSADLLTHVNSVSVDVSSDDLLNAKAAPIVLIPALDSGFIVVPTTAIFQYKTVATDYTLGDATQLFIGSSVNPLVVDVLLPIPATILSGGTPGNMIGVFPAGNAVSYTQSWFENQSLVLTHNGTAELTLGDGTATVKVYYTVIAV